MKGKLLTVEFCKTCKALANARAEHTGTFLGGGVVPPAEQEELRAEILSLTEENLYENMYRMAVSEVMDVVTGDRREFAPFTMMATAQTIAIMVSDWLTLHPDYEPVPTDEIEGHPLKQVKDILEGRVE